MNIWARSSSLFQTDAPFGALDCLNNSISAYLWSVCNDYQAFCVHNWDFYYIQGSDNFGASLSKEQIGRLLRETYGIEFQEIRFDEIPFNKMFIISLNAKQLDFIKECYGKKDQMHYVLAQVEADNVMLYSPFYSVRRLVTKDFLQQAWSELKKPIFSLNQLNTEVVKSNISPYLLCEDYFTKYNSTLRNIFERYKTLSEQNDYSEFESFFGRLRCIELARRRHFEALETKSDFEDRILNGWVSVLKNVIRSHTLLGKYEVAVLNSLQEVVKYEIEYLKSFQYNVEQTDRNS
ncbi:hypothetical protein [Paenibacillus sp. IITD108]|uniref:hypothetical protein n=1 Tax=Paenibacillus sp. IITD108 TaxID=3116649 RepID=UPI002F41CFA2